MIDQVQPSQLQDWIQAKQAQGPAVVLDVREAWELQTASVKAENFAFLHIPMNLIPGKLSELDPGPPLPACAPPVDAACRWPHFWRSRASPMSPMWRGAFMPGLRK